MKNDLAGIADAIELSRATLTKMALSSISVVSNACY